MADHAKIIVHPSGAESDLLPARDALMQILDFVDLLVQTHTGRDHTDGIVWLLESISSNSPVTAQIRGVGSDPSVPVDREATRAMAIVAGAIEAAIEGKDIPHWMLNGGYGAARRFFARNTQSIGRTDIVMSQGAGPIYIAPARARVALINLERAALAEEKKVRDWTHKAHGSVEGIVIDTTTHYGKPAIRVKERLSGREIICVFDAEAAKQIGEKYNWDKTWSHGRVRVEGVLHYDKAGNVVRVSGSDVVEIVSKKLDIADFADRTFTGGLTPTEYLDRWRDRGRD